MVPTREVGTPEGSHVKRVVTAIRLILRVVWAVVSFVTYLVTAFVVAPAAAFAVAVGAFVFLPLPGTIPDADPPDLSRPTMIFDSAGNHIGVLRGFESVEPMTPDDVPDVLKRAVVAAEDRRFYEHAGVDPYGTLRALITDLRTGERVQGGSTITQQYVKQVHLTSERTVTRKIREAILASRIDRELSKDEILFRYLQVSYFGSGAYGAAAAAERYFRKPLAELTLSEAATLAGVLPAPSAYNPWDDLQTAERRRRLVLDLMLETGSITVDDHAQAIREELWALSWDDPAPEHHTVVFPPEDFRSPYPYFVDYVRRWLFDRYGEDRVLRDGLRVYTTLDPAMQAAAEEEVTRVLDPAPEGLAMSIVTIEPQTGFVRALVGGRDYYAPGGQVNLALGTSGGGSGRQPGSAFKPFVLAEAFERGITPDRLISGAPHEVGDTTFGNYGGARYGDLTIADATIRSANTPFTRLTEELGVEAVLNRAADLGADVRPYDPSRDGIAVALGSAEVSPLGMAAAYATFAAGGRRADPLPVSLVTDADGNVIDDFTNLERPQVIDPNTAANINAILEQVLTEGTAAGRGINRPAAGKTGTTTAHRDAWFVGYTPSLSTAVWLGYRDQPEPLLHINGVAAVTGGSIPAATWQRYMLRATEGIDPTGFDEPAPILPRVEADDVTTTTARWGPKTVKTPATFPTVTYIGEMPDPPTAELPAPLPTTVPPSTITTGPRPPQSTTTTTPTTLPVPTTSTTAPTTTSTSIPEGP